MTGTSRFSAKGATSSALSLVAPAQSHEDRLLPATRESYREAMRQLAGAVSVVTFGRGAERAGLTATSVVSLSADPPTLLFCIQRNSSAYDALAASDAFAVNVLAADQQEFAESFSGSGGLKGGDRYHGRDWRELPSGVCALMSAAAVFDCVIEERLERATHTIVIGQVRHVCAGDGSGALLYWRAAYDQLGWGREELERSIGLCARGVR
jgi:flavin reductase (DIM6/NTAB) family NADH-FMN oxidoreductase RutF